MWPATAQFRRAFSSDLLDFARARLNLVQLLESTHAPRRGRHGKPRKSSGHRTLIKRRWLVCWLQSVSSLPDESTNNAHTCVVVVMAVALLGLGLARSLLNKPPPTSQRCAQGRVGSRVIDRPQPPDQSKAKLAKGRRLHRSTKEGQHIGSETTSEMVGQALGLARACRSKPG